MSVWMKASAKCMYVEYTEKYDYNATTLKNKQMKN